MKKLLVGFIMFISSLHALAYTPTVSDNKYVSTQTNIINTASKTKLATMKKKFTTLLNKARTESLKYRYTTVLGVVNSKLGTSQPGQTYYKPAPQPVTKTLNYREYETYQKRIYTQRLSMADSDKELGDKYETEKNKCDYWNNVDKENLLDKMEKIKNELEEMSLKADTLEYETRRKYAGNMDSSALPGIIESVKRKFLQDVDNKVKEFKLLVAEYDQQLEIACGTYTTLTEEVIKRYGGDGRYCATLNSCSEAKYFFSQGNATFLDLNNDGIPCNTLCQ